MFTWNTLNMYCQIQIELFHENSGFSLPKKWVKIM
jgi:hypothetical protein